jgi:hypothetical protein
MLQAQLAIKDFYNSANKNKNKTLAVQIEMNFLVLIFAASSISSLSFISSEMTCSLYINVKELRRFYCIVERTSVHVMGNLKSWDLLYTRTAALSSEHL